jgi:transcriptional regulator of acetoin/glycerol metabolism
VRQTLAAVSPLFEGNPIVATLRQQSQSCDILTTFLATSGGFKNRNRGEAFLNVRYNPFSVVTPIRDRTMAGLTAARARGRIGGRPRIMDQSKIEMAKSLMADTKNSIKDICKTLSISKTTLYRRLKAAKA